MRALLSKSVGPVAFHGFLQKTDDFNLRLRVGVDIALRGPGFACPASSWTSRNDPPTVDIFLAALVMKVRRSL